MAAESDPYVMVAAIDFGTTYSGYAFSFYNDKENIKVHRNWGEAVGFPSYQTPTTVLTKGDGEFLAFGYEAEKKFTEADDDSDEDSDEDSYEDSDEDEKHDERPAVKNLYRHFKMLLHNKEKLTTRTVVCSTMGQLTPAIGIFSYALRFLRQHLLGELSKQVAELPADDLIRWVITVPAIWLDEAKQFMREAALRSGCISSKDSKQLVIALEPEAASFFCRQLHLANFADAKHVSFPSGTQYLVLDCGGGTNDMVAHEVVLDYKVKELFAVNGGSHGGIRIDDKFIQLLKHILGDRFIEEFKSENPQQWFSFISKFERAKKTAAPDGKSKIRVELPYSFPGKYAAMNSGKSLEKHLKGMKAKGINCTNGELVLANVAVKELFAETVHEIVRGVKQALRHPKVRHIDYILMVGGFSESPFLQQAIKDAFGGNGCKVLIPAEAQLAVIKGAVLYGYKQHMVVSRIARRSYGVAVSHPFIPAIHDPSKKYIDPDGEERCNDIFSPLIVKDEEIDTGTRKEQVIGTYKNRVEATVPLYSLSRAPREPVEYTDAPGMTKIGRITVSVPHDPERSKRKVTVTFTFGSTEILVEVKASTGSDTASTTIDFLSD